jgi:hypothetical protein
MLIRTNFIAATLIVLLGTSAQAQAEQPANGFGLFGGISSHSMTPQNSAAADYSSSGVSLGIDYQFGLADSFSLNPFLMSAGERVSGGISDATSGHGILGVEGRYWINSEYFLGAHVGSYSEVLQSNSSNVSTSASGGGFGLTVGWENNSRTSAFGGIFVALQVDKAKIHYDNADVGLSGLRMHIGYRWK